MKYATPLRLSGLYTWTYVDIVKENVEYLFRTADFKDVCHKVTNFL